MKKMISLAVILSCVLSVPAFADKKHPKNTVRYPELFQGQNGSKKVPGL